MVLKPINCEFDPSNKAFTVTVPIIYHYDASEDVPKWTELSSTVYTSLGAAQAFFRHWITGDWYQYQIGGRSLWAGDLKTDFPGGGYMVVLHEALLREKP